VDVNLIGPFRVTDIFTLHLIARGAGDMVTISSGSASPSFPLMLGYAASKGGVHAFASPCPRSSPRRHHGGGARAPAIATAG